MLKVVEMKLRTCFSNLALVIGVVVINAQNSALAVGSIADFQEGLTAFKAKNYSSAITHFKKYMEGRKPDSRSTYYLALANLHSNNRSSAKQLFEYIVTYFPNSVEATHSKSALKLWSGSTTNKELEVKEETLETSTASKEPKIGRYQDKRLVHTDAEYIEELAAIPEKSILRMNYTGGITFLMVL